VPVPSLFSIILNYCSIPFILLFSLPCIRGIVECQDIENFEWMISSLCLFVLDERWNEGFISQLVSNGLMELFGCVKMELLSQHNQRIFISSIFFVLEKGEGGKKSCLSERFLLSMCRIVSSFEDATIYLCCSAVMNNQMKNYPYLACSFELCVLYTKIVHIALQTGIRQEDFLTKFLKDVVLVFLCIYGKLDLVPCFLRLSSVFIEEGICETLKAVTDSSSDEFSLYSLCLLLLLHFTRELPEREMYVEKLLNLSSNCNEDHQRVIMSIIQDFT
jgi:hypothetical protein